MMHARDIGFLCGWIAGVGLLVDLGWTYALVVLWLAGLIIGFLNWERGEHG